MSREKTTITFIVDEGGEGVGSGRSMIPNLESTSLRTVEVSKNVLAESLAGLLGDVNEMIAQAHAKCDGPARIDEIAVSLNVSRNGGIHWIASLGANVSGGMTVRFKVK